MIVNHVGHCVSDLERAKRFYTEVFGFEEWFALQVPDAGTDRLLRLAPPLGLTACYLRAGSFVLELLHYSDAALVDAGERTFNERGLTHLSLCVDDVAATCALVEANGGTVLHDTNIGAAVMVRDPDGQILELLPMGFRSRLPA